MTLSEDNVNSLNKTLENLCFYSVIYHLQYNGGCLLIRTYFKALAVQC